MPDDDDEVDDEAEGDCGLDDMVEESQTLQVDVCPPGWPLQLSLRPQRAPSHPQPATSE